MDMQSCRKGWVIKSVLSFTFKVVQSTGISKKTKVQFFNSFMLTQLANLYQYAKDSEEEKEQSIRQAVHEILLKICGSFKFGICFTNTSGAFATKYALILLTCLTVLYIHVWKRAFEVRLLHASLIAYVDSRPLLMMNEAEDCTSQKAFLVLLLAHTQSWKKLLYTVLKATLVLITP